MSDPGDPADGRQRATVRALIERLERRDYLVGDDITLADYSVINIEGFKDMVPFDWSPYPHVNAYYERMRTVPHWAQTARSETLLSTTPLRFSGTSVRRGT